MKTTNWLAIIDGSLIIYNKYSHVAKVKVKIRNLAALKEAAKMLGLEFVEQNTYRWFGRHVGDYPMPAGFTREDLGKCKYAIRIPNNKTAYEVGVVESKTEPGSYELLWDFWSGGYGLQDKIGKDGKKLVNEYSAQIAIQQLLLKKMKITRSVNTKGQIILLGQR